MKTTIFYFAGRAGDLLSAINKQAPAPSVDELLAHLGNVTGLTPEMTTPKCKTCGGMGYLAQLDTAGESIDTIECPQCHPAYSTNK